MDNIIKKSGKGKFVFAVIGLAVTAPSFLHPYVGRFVLCKKDNLHADLKKWDILWLWRWKAHDGEVLGRDELVCSQRPRNDSLFSDSKQAGKFFRYFLAQVHSVRTIECVCCGKTVAGKVLLRWVDDDVLMGESSSWVYGGMVKFRKPFRVWPPHRIGRVSTVADGENANDDENGQKKQQQQNHNFGLGTATQSNIK